jgi:uncharacterized membrane protein
MKRICIRCAQAFIIAVLGGKPMTWVIVIIVAACIGYVAGVRDERK